KTVTKQVADRQRGKNPMSGRTKLVDTLTLPGGQWRPHDLRRTGASMMAELGVLSDVVERCLNHAEENKMKRIYQRATYEAQMQEAWRMLGQRLELLWGGTGNVVVLKIAA
ncbi:MAG: site-specific integrase, partial [Pseudomonadota bacterium]